ncbi:MAG: hypothetical protein ACR2N3_04775 [Pyrinomonadaceae bacterium]
MNDIINVLIPVLLFIAIYFLGWSKGNSIGYQNALQKLADGSIHLTINVKPENLHNQEVTIKKIN